MDAVALDAGLVRRHLAALEGAVENLRHFAGRSLAELRGDLDARWAVERGLEICAKNALDVAAHLAAARGQSAADAAGAIERVGELGVLPRDFAERFRAIASLREVLTHAHLEYDVSYLHATLNQRLDELAQFAGHVQTWLDRVSR
jgi:uncharacterized protein YutE (UPF0331/DUF86 family)